MTTDLKKELARLNGERDRVNDKQYVMMPKEEGKVIVRILPWKDSIPFVRTRLHTIHGKNYHCPRVLQEATGFYTGVCPICDLYNSLWNQSKKVNEEEAKKLQAEARSLKPVERYYYNAIVRGLEDEGPKILSVGQTLHKKIILALVGDDNLELPALGDITCPKTGRDLNIVKKIKKSDGLSFPNYDLSTFSTKSLTIPQKDFDKWMEARNDLNNLVRLLPVGELQSIVDAYKSGGTIPETPVAPVSQPKVVVPTRSHVKVEPIDEPDEFGLGDEFMRRLTAEVKAF